MNNLKTVRAIARRIGKGERDLGRVYSVEEGGYILLNYTQGAMFSGNMTEVEKACRGLVVREDGKIMAIPMPKFFNLGEPQCPSLPDEPYDITEKIDGSLGIFWHDGEKWRCNTRGSFSGEIVEFAQRWWDENVDSSGLRPLWTIMVEICMDDDPYPRAVRHDEGLYLIAVRNKHSGTDIPLADPGWYRIGLAHLSSKGSMTMQNILDRKTDTEGLEGWVVRFQSGLRVKIKTPWYLRIFHAIQDLTPRRIRDLMVAGNQDWINAFPDDLRPEALQIQQEIEENLHSELLRIYKAYSDVAGIEKRKGYALEVLDKYPDIAGWLFRLRDNKFDELDVLRKMEV